MKRSKVAISSVVVVLLLGSCLALVAADGDNLRYKMKKGESLTYTQISKTEIIQEVMGAEQEMEMNVKAKVKLTSEGKDDDGNLVQMMVYESFVAEMFNAMMDSTLENPEGIVGKRIRKVLTPNGDQIETVRVDTFELGMLGRGGSFPGDRGFLPDLPEEALKMGESVSRSDVDSTEAMGGTTIITTNINYTLVGMESKGGYDCLKISAEGTVKIEGDGKMQGMNIFIEGDGDVESTIFFTAEEGLLVASETQSDMEMTIAITGQQNMTIPMTQSTKTSLTLEK